MKTYPVAYYAAMATLPLAALLGAVDAVSPRRADYAAPPSPQSPQAFLPPSPPSPSVHYRLVAAQRTTDSRSFIALVAGRYPRGTKVFDTFTRALAAYAKYGGRVALSRNLRHASTALL